MELSGAQATEMMVAGARGWGSVATTAGQKPLSQKPQNQTHNSLSLLKILTFCSRWVLALIFVFKIIALKIIYLDD